MDPVVTLETSPEPAFDVQLDTVYVDADGNRPELKLCVRCGPRRGNQFRLRLGGRIGGLLP
ncbi:hypothetical protein GCM10027404_18930 [Arthrobacter tumbae]